MSRPVNEWSETGRLRALAVGESTLFEAPDGVAKKMRSLTATMTRLPGLYTARAFYAVSANGGRELLHVVQITREA